MDSFHFATDVMRISARKNLILIGMIEAYIVESVGIGYISKGLNVSSVRIVVH